MRLFFKKFKKIFLKESGQSLIEIVIALAIGAILIGGASTAVVVVLQSSKTSQIQQSATALAQGLVENVRVYSFADWSNIYGLNKTSSTVYFMHSSSTDNFHLEGKEGVVENGIKSGLVGHWKLDSASGSVAYDFSGNNNSGVLNNGVLRATSSLCQVGGCFEFDGTDDYVSVPDLGFSGDVSVSALAWIKVDEEAGTKNNIFGFGNAGNSNEVFSIRTIGNGAFRFYFWSNDLDVAVEPYYGTWTHVAAVYNASSSERYVYVNGVKAGSDTPTDPNFSDSNYRISSFNGEDFNGLIDDVRVYNRVLTDGEIENLYDSTMFDRYFYVENVCRTNDANYEISGAAPCEPGQVLDPLSQKVTGVIEWPGKEEETSFSLPEYITRWKNDVFTQSDWSGGEGLDGPVSDYTDSFSSSTGINYSDLGEIKIEGF